MITYLTYSTVKPQFFAADYFLMVATLYLCRYCQFQESSCSNRLLASRRSLALSLFLLLNYGLFVVDRIQTYPSGNFRGGSEVSVDYLRPSVHFLRPHAARIM